MSEVTPPSLEMALNEAARWVASGDYDRAIARCNELNAVYPDAVRIVRLRARAYELSDNPAKAIEDYTRALDVLPADAGLIVGLARCQHKVEQFSEAAVNAQQALAHEPRDADALRIAGDSVGGVVLPGCVAIAKAWFAAGLTNRALTEMRRLTTAEPDRTDLQVVMAEMLWRMGMKVTTVELCNTILDEEPDCLNAHVILSALWTRIGSVAMARNHTHAVERLDPDFHVTHDWLGKPSPFAMIDVPAQPPPPGPAAEAQQKEEENNEELDRSAWVDELIAAAGPVTPGAARSAEDDTVEVETITPLEWTPAHEGLGDEVPAWLTALRTQPVKTDEEVGDRYILDESPLPPSDATDAARVVSVTRWSPDTGEQAPHPPDGAKTTAPSEPTPAAQTSEMNTAAPAAVPASQPEAAPAPPETEPALPEAAPDTVDTASASTDAASLSPDAAEPKRSRKARAVQDDDVLQLARQALQMGQYEEAADYYNSLIQAEKKLDAILADLDRVTHQVSQHQHPEIRRFHALLGDVYTRKGEINAALMAYHRALDKD